MTDVLATKFGKSNRFQMLVRTTEGLRPHDLYMAICDTPKQAVEHCRHNHTTMGFTIQYALNPSTRQCVEIVKEGKLCQRDIKQLMADGFTVFAYSGCFAAKQFQFDGHPCALVKTIDLTGNLGDHWCKALHG